MSKSSRNSNSPKRKNTDNSANSPMKSVKVPQKRTPAVERTSEGTIEDTPEEAAP